MKQAPTQLEPLAVRRAQLVDKDKVRYRVYSSPTEFIAVIAENALVAIKLSGVSKPHKIVRDLPTEGIAIEAKKMAHRDDAIDERIEFSTTLGAAGLQGGLISQLEEKKQVTAESLFEPMRLSDMKAPSNIKTSILPPELLVKIIEAHVRSHVEQAVSTVSVSAAQAPQAAAELVAPEPAHASPVASDVEQIESKEISQEERVLAMANEVLPPVSVNQEEIGKRELSPSEVEKLLNE